MVALVVAEAAERQLAACEGPVPGSFLTPEPYPRLARVQGSSAVAAVSSVYQGHLCSQECADQLCGNHHL